MNAPIVHGGGITAAAAIYGGEAEHWLDLSTGINPCPVPVPEIPMRAWHRLPDRHLIDQARAAAQSYYRSGDILPLPVPGTQSLIQLLPRLFDGGGKRVAILAPTYGEYERAFPMAGCCVELIAGLDDVRADHAVVVVVNPNNPDGRIYAPERLVALSEEMKARGAVVIVDEAFGDTCPEMSLVPLASRMPNVVISRSFGKFFGLAGLRLGFVVAALPIVERIEGLLGPWAVSGPALSIAADLLRSDIAPIQLRISERSGALRKVLDQGGLRIIGGTDLFALVDHKPAAQLHRHLCQHHILVRKFDYQPRWLRFGLTADAAGDQRLSDALQSYTS
ncbi:MULTISPECIES: threonine-phosphate decarboxylase CobD [Rhizobium]|uniref:threonine-phosphate decarboxylase n=1 Tax=Rhizobium favelukesii TaxID=348824 RepID=W6RA32_9HYPH|nr:MULTISPECIES: threonine-phosphate decarboxylase CobD [Rhizobium]MCA0802216.1 threonine-phosphate decarboxylase CobD [Rhizobium sp. T1473]MCS0458839.1 threonine-phosphate decarboxylase CobD [Rhizobium favelukesii]UFS80762.1 threonine-phosphate decarboxylase CobD [Rhizobium sp. T136]CDM57784.1 putative pyridoxal-phosphate-dependent aminotransferase protein [Rhizobium favelukesii]